MVMRSSNGWTSAFEPIIFGLNILSIVLITSAPKDKRIIPLITIELLCWINPEVIMKIAVGSQIIAVPK